ncbi:olfactory receptor 10A3-like [Periophthalmus magnuspinnatus]|uniref:olfactory receptor 10A3-like n=1 Tax=Periophthalmus magnuspinnatus TaxID=409849 RepID=UPI00145BBCE5|nr:olfactory receptor 10A3-like [Periophthalmus magnuspinnatus]
MGGNTTQFLFFNLTMFLKIEVYRYPAFVLCLLIYCFILFANLVVITVISRERSLHEPMYLFIACLSFNALYGSTGFFPRFLMDLLSDTHLISRPACFIQVYTIYSFVGCDLMILGVMAYDRYAAVCYPLHYHRKMNLNTFAILAVVTYIYPFVIVIACVLLSAKLPLCGNKIHKVYCANWNIVKLSCVSTALNNMVGMLLSITVVFIPLLFVLYTYLRIVTICWKASSEYKGKIFQNCLPHIISFTTFCLASFCDVILSRIDLEMINPVLAVILSMEVVIITPIVNPLVYGLKLPEIRKQSFKMLFLTPKYCK